MMIDGVPLSCRREQDPNYVDSSNLHQRRIASAFRRRTEAKRLQAHKKKAICAGLGP